MTLFNLERKKRKDKDVKKQTATGIHRWLGTVYWAMGMMGILDQYICVLFFFNEVC